MTEVVVSPDCELLVIQFLDALTSEPVSSNSPKLHRGVRVTEVPFAGFEDTSPVYRALLSLEFWHPDRVAAKTLALTLTAYLHAATTFYADCGSPGFLPDPDTGTPRYVTTCELAVRGSILP